jgi:hypothetical protein
MPRKRNWKLSCSKTALLNPKAKEKRPDDVDNFPHKIYSGMYDEYSDKLSDNLFEPEGNFEFDNLFDNVFEPEGNFWYCCSGGQYPLPAPYQHQSSHTSVSGQTNSIFESTFLKFGKFDQSDSRFSSETRGNQCICNCLVFLALTSYKINNKNVGGAVSPASSIWLSESLVLFLESKTLGPVSPVRSLLLCLGVQQCSL